MNVHNNKGTASFKVSLLSHDKIIQGIIKSEM